MAEQTTPQHRESQPRTDWDIGKALNGFFPQAEEPPAAEEEQDEDEGLEADEVPYPGTAESDEDEEELDEEASGGDEDADPEDEATSEDEPFLVLTVEGKSIPVGSKEEAIALAQKGKHYTQEMQRLRDAQRQWEGEREQMTTGLRSKEEQYSTALRALSETYGYVLGEEAPDWSSDDMQRLKSEKPNEYLALREQWDQLGAIRSEIQRVTREQQEQQQKQFQGWVADQQNMLAEKRPEWSDPARRQQDWGLIRDYATSQGVTEDEISNLYDHRFWMILHDAARYRQAEATGKTKRESAKSKTVEPGTGSGVNKGKRRLRAERDSLRQTGDVRAAGNIFQELMTKPRK